MEPVNSSHFASPISLLLASMVGLFLVVSHLKLEGIRSETFLVSFILPRVDTGEDWLPGHNWPRQLHFFDHFFPPLGQERNPWLEFLPEHLLLCGHPEHSVGDRDGRQDVVLGGCWLREGLVTSQLQGDARYCWGTQGVEGGGFQSDRLPPVIVRYVWGTTCSLWQSCARHCDCEQEKAGQTGHLWTDWRWLGQHHFIPNIPCLSS